mmetsp:Transcript_43080/g.51700  ORF Transcript_43080/g.51700 Transcript_43080/m.51700 type:complete len:132 (+) Transcript_43080:975-1370(+)
MMVVRMVVGVVGIVGDERGDRQCPHLKMVWVWAWNPNVYGTAAKNVMVSVNSGDMMSRPTTAFRLVVRFTAFIGGGGVTIRSRTEGESSGHDGTTKTDPARTRSKVQRNEINNWKVHVSTISSVYCTVLLN